MLSNVHAPTVGGLLRNWRERRRLSQLQLAADADISARHLSFIETNRSRPSRDVIVRLSEVLEVPLGERNALFLAAGYAPMYTATPLDAPRMQPVAQILRTMLATKVPTLVVDRYWNVIDMNGGVEYLTRGTAAHLLQPPANALRIALHPDGMAPRILNFAEWRDHLLERLRRETRASGDPKHHALLDELSKISSAPTLTPVRPPELAVTLRLLVDGRELEFMSTIATFGTPVDVTVANVMIESFHPANDQTRHALETLPPT